MTQIIFWYYIRQKIIKKCTFFSNFPSSLHLLPGNSTSLLNLGKFPSLHFPPPDTANFFARATINTSCYPTPLILFPANFHVQIHSLPHRSLPRQIHSLRRQFLPSRRQAIRRPPWPVPRDHPRLTILPNLRRRRSFRNAKVINLAHISVHTRSIIASC